MRAHLLLFLIVACDSKTNYEPGVQAGAPWPVIGHDEGFTARSDVVATHTGQVKWTHDTGAFIGTASPVIAADGTIYIGNGAGTFSAVRSDGTLAWTAQMGAVEGAAAISVDGHIYVGSDDTRLHVLSPAGIDVTTNVGGDSISSSVLVDQDGTAYFTMATLSCNASPGGDISCGTTVAVAGGLSNTAFAFADHRLYVADVSGVIDAFTTQPPDPKSSVVAAQGALGAVSSDGVTYVLVNQRIEPHDASAAFLWACDVPVSLQSMWLRVAVARSDLVMLVVDSTVLAASPNGVAWSVDVGARVSGGLAVDAEGAVFFGADDGALHALDASGSPLFFVQTGGPVRSAPAIAADGTVVFGSDDGRLYAVGP